MCVCKECCVGVEGDTGKCKGRDTHVCVCVEGEMGLCVDGADLLILKFYSYVHIV